jgi:hypothetical protein
MVHSIEKEMEAMDAAMVREDRDEMDERAADGGAGGLRGWIGTVYAVHPETPIVFDWDGEWFTVGFGRDGADLRVRFTLASIGYLVRFVGGTLVTRPETLEDYEIVGQPPSVRNQRADTTYDVEPYCPVQLWRSDAGRWLQLGHGPQALTLVLAPESVGWLLVGFGDWLALRLGSAHPETTAAPDE